jgi:hypothetical protein
MMRLRHNILQGGVRPASLEVDLPVAQSRPDFIRRRDSRQKAEQPSTST